MTAPELCSLCRREKYDPARHITQTGGACCPSDPTRDPERWRLAYHREAACSDVLAGGIQREHEAMIAWKAAAFREKELLAMVAAERDAFWRALLEGAQIVAQPDRADTLAELLGAAR